MTAAATWQARYALGAASVAGGLIAWAFAAHTANAPDLLPGPGLVLATFVEMFDTGEIERAIAVSAGRVAAGYVIGVLAGVLTGVLLGSHKFVGDAFGPVFDFLKGIPPIALVPIVIIWLGIGETSKYVVIAYVVGVILVIHTAVAAREVPLIRLRAGAFLGLSPPAVFFRILLPSCLPGILSGMRSAIGFAFVALVSAELIAANSGLGQIIMDSRFSLQTARMIVGLLVLGCFGALVQWCFDVTVARWRFAQRL
jgi:ABC-type nitrate/sulfonate/bicarbonate transport system permease component